MELLIGIAIGAAFSKFWIMAYVSGKTFVLGMMDKKDQEK